MTDLLAQLNESQRKAVVYNDGPSLVIAGAGSGKTRVLTYKIAYLLQQGNMNPWNILALTFTNKAAREMKDRIGKLIGMERARYVQMGTFHSVFSRILRAEAEHIGFNSNFTIYDQSDSRSLVKSVIKEMQLDDKVYKHTSVADRISMAKNHLILPHQYANSAWAHDDAQSKRPAIANIYIRYSERCRQANAMDFDDLLVYTHQLFLYHEDILQKYVDLFQYVLVDEYQDTNFVQQSIVLQLTRDRQRVCVVGDDAQSIYSFRGANIDNILGFTQQYQNAKLFKLEQNYRSTQFIVQAANSLIRKNERQIQKDVFSENEKGERLMLKPAYSDREEAIIVCQDIKRIRQQENAHWGDFAILYRTNSQSRTFEEQMRKENIPYRIYGGFSFYQRKEIKDVIAYFRLVANPDDEEAFKRIINYPTRGIGNTTVDKIIQTATAQNVSLWTVISEPLSYSLSVNKGTMDKMTAFKVMIDQWRSRAALEDIYSLGHDIIVQSGISRDVYSGREPDDITRQENLEEFLSGMQDFVESRREEDMGNRVFLADFLQEIALLTDLDSDEGDVDDKVALMTIHSAKGLEFPTVFVVGLEENIFPSPMCLGSMRELEEERRLLYVAITRAEKHCILTCAQNRYRYGRMEYDTPSRFINDIDPALLQHAHSGTTPFRTNSFGYRRPDSLRPQTTESTRPQASNPFRSQMTDSTRPRMMSLRQAERIGTMKPSVLSATSASSPQLCEGNVIEHQRFGVGTVLKVEGTGENTKATVQFKNTGVKQLLLKFARYTIVQ